MYARRQTKKFHPHKYYAGLTRKQATQRRAEIEKYGAMDWRDPRAYVGFKTDAYARRTRKSSYSAQWARLFPDARSLSERSAATGVPLRYIKESYDRGLAAWRTGHRPGATAQQWGYARSASFLLCGKTHYGPDSDLVRAARRANRSARAWFKRCRVSKTTNPNK
jgi:hypothetical protein